MTVFGRDASNFDGSISYAGLGYFTHKATEGTTVVHNRFAERLNGARAAGVVGLGSYHVLRTPGNGGNGTLTSQLTYWLTYLDQHTPWWRTYPCWMMQIDAEKWPYDKVSAETVEAFAALLVRSGVPGYKVTYASRGQYGDSLAGIGTDLWNADYRGSNGGSYPGDNWIRAGNQIAGWAPYSGKTPAFLQYSSTPYDHDAFRGSLDEFRALLSGASTQEDDDMTPAQAAQLDEMYRLVKWNIHPWLADATQAASRIEVIVKAIAEKVDLDPTELAEIGQAVTAAVTAASDSLAVKLVDAIEGKLPADTLSRDDLTQAVRTAIEGATAVIHATPE